MVDLAGCVVWARCGVVGSPDVELLQALCALGHRSSHSLSSLPYRLWTSQQRLLLCGRTDCGAQLCFLQGAVSRTSPVTLEVLRQLRTHLRHCRFHS